MDLSISSAIGAMRSEVKLADTVAQHIGRVAEVEIERWVGIWDGHRPVNPCLGAVLLLCHGALPKPEMLCYIPAPNAVVAEW